MPYINNKASLFSFHPIWFIQFLDFLQSVLFAYREQKNCFLGTQHMLHREETKLRVLPYVVFVFTSLFLYDDHLRHAIFLDNVYSVLRGFCHLDAIHGIILHITIFFLYLCRGNAGSFGEHCQGITAENGVYPPTQNGDIRSLF